jgi:hypothetical protein
VVAWGANRYYQCEAPPGESRFVAIAGGEAHSLGLLAAATTSTSEPPLASTGAEPALLRILAAAPNPCRGPVSILLETRASEVVSLEVFDVIGRRVRSLPIGRLQPGRHSLVWHGAAAVGSSPSGVYFLRLRTATVTSRAERVIVVR